jgi:hypothetical protein
VPQEPLLYDRVLSAVLPAALQEQGTLLPYYAIGAPVAFRGTVATRTVVVTVRNSFITLQQGNKRSTSLRSLLVMQTQNRRQGPYPGYASELGTRSFAVAGLGVGTADGHLRRDPSMGDYYTPGAPPSEFRPIAL